MTSMTASNVCPNNPSTCEAAHKTDGAAANAAPAANETTGGATPTTNAAAGTTPVANASVGTTPVANAAAGTTPVANAAAGNTAPMPNYRHGRMKDLIRQMDSPVLHINPDRCVLVRNRNAKCLRCANVCTSHAISLAQDGVHVDPNACIGCGTCASACPTGALEPLNPSDDALFHTMDAALQGGRDRLVVLCSTAAHIIERRDGLRLDVDIRADQTDFDVWAGDDGAEAVAFIPIPAVCLGRVDESLLVEAVACGAREILLVSGDCQHCEHRKGGQFCADIQTSATNLLSAVRARVSIVEVDARKFRCERTGHATIEAKHAQRPAVQQAPEHVTAQQDPAATAAAPTQPKSRTAFDPRAHRDFTPQFTHVQSDGTLPHFVPPRRKRLYNSLKHLGRPEQETVITRLWGQVSIDTDLCSSCRMCTVFCPTGALSRYATEDGAFGVNHRSTLCVQCRLCETICPEGAITVSSTVSLDEFLHGTQFQFEMQPVGWHPGKEDAIATRISRFMKTDKLQDPLARLQPEDIAAQRAYALAREQKREEIHARRATSPTPHETQPRDTQDSDS
jgi:Fe-S-cluster-containing hydrogenase component 2